MNRPMTAADNLRAAATAIERALVMIEATTVECPTCARSIAKDTDQHRVYEALTDTPDKLRRQATLLDTGRGKSGLGYTAAVAARQARQESETSC